MDKLFFIFGDAVVRDFCWVLLHMPLYLLVTKYSPENIESTMFALMASTISFGSMLAGIFGSALLRIYDVIFNFFSLVVMDKVLPQTHMESRFW